MVRRLARRGGGPCRHEVRQAGPGLRVCFFPFAFEHVPGIAADLRLVVFNSQVKAHKGSSARDIFNQKPSLQFDGIECIEE